jgi:hypothetical protein
VPRDLYTDAILGVYELNRVDLLKDVFIWAYEWSARALRRGQEVAGRA